MGKLTDPNGKSPQKNGGEDENTINANANASAPFSHLNLGLFTLTFRKGKYGKIQGIHESGISFQWNFTIERYKKEKTVEKTEKFVYNNIVHGGVSIQPNDQNYPQITVGTTPLNANGESMNTFMRNNNLDESNSGILSVYLHSKSNDGGGGGDNLYQFLISGLPAINHQNGNKNSNLSPTQISNSTTINATLNQAPETFGSNKGRYDECNGYKLVVKLYYQKTKIVTRFRIVPRAPK